MKCGHCDTRNSGTAKFCENCAVRLSPVAVNSAMSGDGVAIAEADITTIPQPEPSFVKEFDSLIRPTDPDVKNQLTTAVSTQLPKTHPSPSRWIRSPIVFAMIACTTVVASAALWSAGLQRTDAGSGAPVLASGQASTRALAQMSKTTSEPVPVALPRLPIGAVTKSAHGQPVRSIKQLSTHSYHAKIRRRASIKRRTVHLPAKKTTARRGMHSANIDRKNAATSPDVKHELPRSISLKHALPTPQQVCADRTNFISRGICESRECAKPERATLKFCVDMHALRAPLY